MQPGMDGGKPPNRKLLYFGAAVVVVGAYYLYKKNQASSAATGSTSATNTASTPYGEPATGTGVLEPILINTGAGSSSATATSNPPATTKPTTPTKSTTTGTSTKPATIPQALQTQTYLNTLVGDWGKEFGLKTPTAAQAAAERKTGGSTAQDQMTEQAWNVGQITQLNKLKTPTVAQIQAKANALYPNYKSLPSLQQQEAQEIANVMLLEQLNPKK